MTLQNGCVQTTSPFTVLRMSSHLTCNVWLWLFDAQSAWLYSANLFFFLKVNVLTVWFKACWVQPTSHKLNVADWLVDWYILAGGSPQDKISTRPRQLCSYVYGKRNLGRWPIFPPTQAAIDDHNPQGWSEYASKQMVRFLIYIYTTADQSDIFCQLNVI